MFPLADISGLSAPSAVLIACVRSPADSSASGALRKALGLVSDWEALTSAALHHGMAGLLYRRVVGMCPDAVPADVLDMWRGRSLRVATRSLRMQRSLVEVMDCLAAADVPALAFKGPVVSQQFYGDSAARHFSDLDLMVPPAYVRSARDVAIGLGYQDVESVWLTAGQHPETHSAEREIELSHPVTGVWLEVHWRTGPRYAENALLAADLLERVESVELLGTQVPCLSRHDAVLVLVVHAAAHQWSRIEDVVALSAALWDIGEAQALELEELAQRSGCLRRLHLGVAIVALLVPDAPCALLTERARLDRSAGRLAESVISHLLVSLAGAVDSEQISPVGLAAGAIWEARTLDSQLQSARYVWRRLFAPTVYDRTVDGGVRSGLLGAAALQVRRQKRLWWRDRG